MLSKLLTRVRRVWRSSITGKFVSKAYAEEHPDTTQGARVILNSRLAEAIDEMKANPDA